MVWSFKSDTLGGVLKTFKNQDLIKCTTATKFCGESCGLIFESNLNLIFSIIFKSPFNFLDSHGILGYN